MIESNCEDLLDDDEDCQLSTKVFEDAWEEVLQNGSSFETKGKIRGVQEILTQNTGKLNINLDYCDKLGNYSSKPKRIGLKNISYCDDTSSSGERVGLRENADLDEEILTLNLNNVDCEGLGNYSSKPNRIGLKNISYCEDKISEELDNCGLLGSSPKPKRTGLKTISYCEDTSTHSEKSDSDNDDESSSSEESGNEYLRLISSEECDSGEEYLPSSGDEECDSDSGNEYLPLENKLTSNNVTDKIVKPIKAKRSSNVDKIFTSTTTVIRHKSNSVTSLPKPVPEISPHHPINPELNFKYFHQSVPPINGGGTSYCNLPPLPAAPPAINQFMGFWPTNNILPPRLVQNEAQLPQAGQSFSSIPLNISTSDGGYIQQFPAFIPTTRGPPNQFFCPNSFASNNTETQLQYMAPSSLPIKPMGAPAMSTNVAVLVPPVGLLQTSSRTFGTNELHSSPKTSEDVTQPQCVINEVTSVNCGTTSSTTKVVKKEPTDTCKISYVKQSKCSENDLSETTISNTRVVKKTIIMQNSANSTQTNEISTNTELPKMQNSPKKMRVNDDELIPNQNSPNTEQTNKISTNTELPKMQNSPKKMRVKDDELTMQEIIQLYKEITGRYESTTRMVRDFFENNPLIKPACKKYLIYRCRLCASEFPDEGIECAKEHFEKEHSTSAPEKDDDDDKFVEYFDKFYQCDQCGKTLQHLRLFIKHVDSFHNSGDQPLRQFSCDKCSFNTFDKYMFSSHVQFRHACSKKKNTLKKIECHLCHLQVIGIKKHLQMHHRATSISGNQVFKCPLCPKTFATLLRATNHRKNVHVNINIDTSQYICRKCGKEYKDRISLTEHLRTHDQNRPHFECLLCKRKLKTKTGFKMHMRCNHSANSDKPATYSCTDCGGRGFRKERELLNHIRREHDPNCEEPKKNHLCETCGKSFELRFMLDRHMVVHTKEKKFVCATCNKAFTQLDSLKTHQVVHTGIKPFECGTCGQKYSQKYPLTQHVKKHHPEIPN